MPLLPLRPLAARPSASVFDAWLEQLAHELSGPEDEWPVVCRRALAALSYPGLEADWETAVEDARLPLATRAALAALDPRNVTLEPEFYAECDDARFQRVKPLLWLWYS